MALWGGEGNTDQNRIFYANQFISSDTVNNTRDTSLHQHSASRMFSAAVLTLSLHEITK